MDESEWRLKGATLSDKTAKKEFGLTDAEIVSGIRAGKLQCREGSMHGNPWIRLLRREVQALAERKHGAKGLKARRARVELARVDHEVRRLKLQLAKLEREQATLRAVIKES